LGAPDDRAEGQVLCSLSAKVTSQFGIIRARFSKEVLPRILVATEIWGSLNIGKNKHAILCLLVEYLLGKRKNPNMDRS